MVEIQRRPWGNGAWKSCLKKLTCLIEQVIGSEDIPVAGYENLCLSGIHSFSDWFKYLSIFVPAACSVLELSHWHFTAGSTWSCTWPSNYMTRVSQVIRGQYCIKQ